MSGNKIICAICYEEAKFLIEDLQSISVCGHVFHELCLQQWLEYCPRGRKPTCPLCKQQCSRNDAHRLFFQSSTEDTQQQTLQRLGAVEEVEALQATVQKLTGQLSVTKTSLTVYQEELKEMNGQLSLCADRAEKAEFAQAESVREKHNLKDALSKIQEELRRSTSERSKLLEKSTSMAKELASHKLTQSLDVDEDEVARLARVGSGANKDDVIGTLTKSLILRNRTYKDLMARCNELGMGESRALRKSEKCAEHVKRLKIRVQELEKSLENKENGDLRLLRACACSCRQDTNRSSNQFQYSSLGASYKSDIGSRSPFLAQSLSQNTRVLKNDISSNDEKYNLDDDLKLKSHGSSKGLQDPEKADDPEMSVNLRKSFQASKQVDEIQVSSIAVSESEQEAGIQKATRKDHMHEVLGAATMKLKVCTDGLFERSSQDEAMDTEFYTGAENDLAPKVDLSDKHGNAESLLSGSGPPDNQLCSDILRDSCLPVAIRKEIRFFENSVSEDGSNKTAFGNFDPSITRTADTQMSNMSKWRKQSADYEKSTHAHHGSSSGTFISFGANGRGGQVKVLKPPSSLTVGGSSSQIGQRPMKRCKSSHTQRQSSNQQVGLQMEHFFGRSAY